ncbi:centromere protein H isoform X2 [Pristis pectinata]|uniref:centromere protein H isoform X2 n=1 Tax=Pristis pectinata TaxID=685728 RepID=UPI00223DA913|nr:centromere protein H isoform X2 [Pristis pectinata]
METVPAVGMDSGEGAARSMDIYRTERSILQELGNSCMKLGQLALDNFHVTPAVGQENAAVTDSILHLMWLKDQVTQQTVELETGVKACVETNTEAVSEDNLKETIQVIERELEDASVSFQQKNMALHRLQYTHALREAAQMNDKEGKLIMETIKHSLDLCSEIIATQKEVHTLENAVFEVQKQRLLLKRKMQGVLKDMRAEKKKQQQLLQQLENELPRRGEKNLQEHFKMVTLIQKVLQGVILASGVNWANDPELKEIVLQLENNPLEETDSIH